MKSHLIRGRQLLLFIAIYLTVLCALLTLSQLASVTVSTAASTSNLPIYSVETADQTPTIALTINCAWGNADIPDILQTLADADVTATFFLVGDFVEQYPDTVLAIFEAGHSVQNHSDSHSDYATMTIEEIQADVRACNEKIAAITGTTPTLVRCPSGSYDADAILAIEALDMQAIQWSLDSLDWNGTTLDEMQTRILPHLQYGDILLFHNDTAHTADALATLIADIKARGFIFDTVENLLLDGDTTLDLSGRQWQTS